MPNDLRNRRSLKAVVIGDRAFYGTSVARFEFGSVLRSIGDLALFDQNLSSIAFSGNNPVYNVKDGILYKGNTTVVYDISKLSFTVRREETM